MSALQRLLNDEARAGLTVSGTYGTGTRDAVAAFQRHYGVDVVGVRGPFTWRRLLVAFRAPGVG